MASSASVVPQDGQQVVGVLAGAGQRDVRWFEAMLDEGMRLGFIQRVDAFDDAGFDCPGAVECRKAAVSDVRQVIEPLVAEGVVLGVVVLSIGLQGCDGVPWSDCHDFILLDAAVVVDAELQKSSVVDASTGLATSTGTGQSVAVMSQNRHSPGLGTRWGGVLAASRRIRDPSSSLNWPRSAPRGMRTVWVGWMTSPPILTFRYCGSASGGAYW